MNGIKISIFPQSTALLFCLNISLVCFSSFSIFAEPYDLFTKVNRIKKPNSSSLQGKALVIPTTAVLLDHYTNLVRRCQSFSDVSNLSKKARSKLRRSKRAFSYSQTTSHQSSAQWKVAIVHLKLTEKGVELVRFYRQSDQHTQSKTLPQWALSTKFHPSIQQLTRLTLPITKTEQQLQNPNINPAVFLGIEWSHISPPNPKSLVGPQRKIHLAHHRYHSQCIIIDVSAQFLNSELGTRSQLFTKGRSPSLMPKAHGDLEAYTFALKAESKIDAQSFLIWRLLKQALRKQDQPFD